MRHLSDRMMYLLANLTVSKHGKPARLGKY